jgi:hypothetical protein
MSIDEVGEDQALREKAIKQLRKQREFRGHLLVYVLVNTFLVVVWALTNPDGFFWPVVPIALWGIGVIMNAWDVYRGEEFSEAQIHHEMERFQGHR